jgi:sphinganine-1-phosphate aldolase
MGSTGKWSRPCSRRRGRPIAIARKRTGGARAFIHAFNAGEEVRAVGEAAYLEFLGTSALGPSVYPSIAGFEAALIDFTRGLLGAGPDAVGHVTMGGTESVFLALKAARDRARETRPEIAAPAVVVTVPAHEGDLGADLTAMARALTDETVALVGSMPTYWHGVVDPIAAMGELAAARGLWLHVDACMGGFLAPFARAASYAIPPFDFFLPGVTSISADLHKYGYAPKGASVIMLREAGLDRHLVFDQAGGHGSYRASTFAATRTGAPIAAAWAVMRHLGQAGYRSRADAVMRAHAQLVADIGAIDGLYVLGSPDLAIVSFGARGLDIHATAAGLRARGWVPNIIRAPDAIHLRLAPGHAPLVPRFLDDLAAAVGDSG